MKKKRFWALFTSLLVLSIIVVVYALPTGVNFGHDAKDIYVDGTVLKQYITENNRDSYIHEGSCYPDDTVLWRTDNKTCTGRDAVVWTDSAENSELVTCSGTTVTVIGTNTWSINKPTTQSETYTNYDVVPCPTCADVSTTCGASTATCTTPTYALCKPNGY